MLPLLILLFTVLPVLELALLFKVGGAIGALNTVSLVLVTGVVGAMLARWQGIKTLASIQRQLAQGQLPTAELANGALILVAGALLVTPGVITDVVGLSLLLPPVRAGMRIAFRAWAAGRVQQFDLTRGGGPFVGGPFAGKPTGSPFAQPPLQGGPFAPPPFSGFPAAEPDYGPERVVDVQAEVRDPDPS